MDGWFHPFTVRLQELFLTDVDYKIFQVFQHDLNLSQHRGEIHAVIYMSHCVLSYAKSLL